MTGSAAMTDTAETTIQRRLAPLRKSAPSMMATSTRAVPRSGWIMISRNGGAVSRPAPTYVDSRLILSLRPARNAANTAIMSTFEISENWNVRPATDTHRWAPLISTPIAIVTSLVDQKREGKFVQIRVEDQGRGIDPDVRDHMFEPFISTKHTVGVGMGLTVARHSLRNMGGEVSVEDRPGGGAVAILMHPFEQRQRRLAND